MKIKLNTNTVKLVLLWFVFSMMISCEDLVEDGYRIEYAESDATFTADPLDLESGAIGDIISYKLIVDSDHFIKSCVVQATREGANGSGYDVTTEGYDDPFADHSYGTVKKGITSFVVKYDYIIPQGINKSKITFSLIDEMGKVSARVDLNVVPAIKKYPGKELFAKNNLFNDAFASIDGLVYPDIKSNYSTLSEENLTVQEKIDIIYYYDKGANLSVISSPDDSRIPLELQVENATRFKKLSGISEEAFNTITAASLVNLTLNDSISYKGTSQVRGIAVGDIVGFSTDVNATHSLKTGLIKVNGLHPTNVEHYDGTAYVMECDIITQIDQ